MYPERLAASKGVMSGRTKADVAYQRFRRAIVVGELTVEDPLDEAVLMERYDFGRTPIREALKRLALEQFVIWPPRRTPYVRGITAVEMARLYEARTLLEEHTAMLAATRASASELDELSAIVAAQEDNITRGEVYEAVERDHELHHAIALASHNRFLAESVKNLNCGSLRLWFLAHSQLGMAGTVDQHRAIIDALRGHDPAAAARHTREHVEVSYRRQMELARLATTPAVPHQTVDPVAVTEG